MISPKAGDLETPHLPLGNSSQSFVQAIYDICLFAQKIGLTVSSAQDLKDGFLQGSHFYFLSIFKLCMISITDFSRFRV